MNDPSQNQNRPKAKKLPVLVWVLCGALAAAVIGALIVSGGHGSGQAPDPDAAVEIQTAYGTLRFPEAYIDHLHHKETKEGQVTTEVFSMVLDEAEQELFHISFGDAEDDSTVGYLHTEQGLVAVSLYVAELDMEVFPDDEAREHYLQMRACVDTVLESITSDERFSEHRFSEVGTQLTELSYWSVTLPQGVVCEERIEGNVYRAVFYGMVGAERVKLYTVSVDDDRQTASIGAYQVDGVLRQIHIETEDPAQFDILPEDEKYQAYRYMDTVNDVITAITESENYVDAVSPES